MNPTGFVSKLSERIPFGCTAANAVKSAPLGLMSAVKWKLGTSFAFLPTLPVDVVVGYGGSGGLGEGGKRIKVEGKFFVY